MVALPSEKAGSLADAAEENDLLREQFVSRRRPNWSTGEAWKHSAYVITRSNGKSGTSTHAEAHFRKSKTFFMALVLYCSPVCEYQHFVVMSGS